MKIFNKSELVVLHVTTVNPSIKIQWNGPILHCLQHLNKIAFISI